MVHYGGPQTAINIALTGDLYLSIIMVPYGGPQTAHIITLPGGLYFAIIIVRYAGHQTALTIALHGRLYLDNTVDLYGGPQIPLACRPLLSHYNAPFWRNPHCPYYSLSWRHLLSKYIRP
jgi:hypothetical protein